MARGFLLDMGISPKVADALQGQGLQTVHVKDLGLACAEDTRIMEEARRGNLVVIATDNDFAAHAVLDEQPAPSIVTLRLGNPSAQDQIEAVLRVLKAVSLDQMDGCLFTLDERRLRRRSLRSE